MPHLKITEVLLVHCNIVNNNYQQYPRVSYPFVPNKSFAQLLDISPENFIFLKTFKSEFSYIEVWFTDQRYSVQPRDLIIVKGYGFLSFAKNIGRNIGKSKSKNLSGKYSQKTLNHAKKFARDELKTSSKKYFKKRQKQLVI